MKTSSKLIGTCLGLAAGAVSCRPSSGENSRCTMSKAGNRLGVGKPRAVGSGARPWRAGLYTPGDRYRLYRVRLEEESDQGWLWTSRTAPTEAEARHILTQVEGALDAMTAAPVRASLSRAAVRGMPCGCLPGRQHGTIQGRTDHRAAREPPPQAQPPGLGNLPVAHWRVAHSRTVIEGARVRGVKSVGHLADICVGRGCMSRRRTERRKALGSTLDDTASGITRHQAGANSSSTPP